MALTRPEAVTVALYSLGGAEGPVDTEDIAIHAHRLAPDMFSWKKYPDMVDKELVRVALSDARLKKNWVVGSHDRGGWLLTPDGQRFARKNESLLERSPAPERRAGRADKQIERERARLNSSAAFELIRKGSGAEVTVDEADAFFRINVYVQGQDRERKIARIENQFGDDVELGDVVRTLAKIARGREGV